MADDADKINEPYRAPEQVRAEPAPPGYFEGESLTRRKVFTIAAQGLGGLAGAAIILPAVGFAVAPIFHRGKERWEDIGPTSNFVEDTYRQVTFTETPGIGDVGKTLAYVRKSSKELGEEPGQLFARATDNWRPEGWLAQLGWTCRLGREGGLFFTVGRRI